MSCTPYPAFPTLVLAAAITLLASRAQCQEIELIDSLEIVAQEAVLPPDEDQDKTDTTTDSTYAYLDSVMGEDDILAQIDTGVETPLTEPTPIDELSSTKRSTDVKVKDWKLPVSKKNPIVQVLKSFKSIARRFIDAARHNRLTRYAKRNIQALLTGIAAIVVIAAALIFYFRKRDSERFLTTTRLSVMDKEVQRTCAYIEKNFENHDLSLEHICEQLVTGPAFVEALFAHELGMTVSEFIDQVRINRAKMLLRGSTAADITELASQVGFSDPRQFSRTFERITGTSPERYTSLSA